MRLPATARKVWEVLDFDQRRALIGLVPLMWLGMVLELGTVGLFVPVMVEIVGAIQGISSVPESDFFRWLPDRWGVGQLLTILLLTYLSKALFFSWLLYRQASFCQGLQAEVSVRLYRGYLGQPYAFHLERGSAGLLRNLIQASHVLALGVVSPLLSLMTEAFVFLGLTGLILYVEPTAALIVGLTVIVLVGSVLKFSRKPVARWGEARHRAESDRLRNAGQGLDNFREVSLTGRQARFVASFREPTLRSARASTRHSYLIELPRFWLELLMVSGVVALVAVLRWQGESMAAIVPIVGLVAAGAMRLVPSAGRLLTAFNTFRFGAAALDEIHGDLVTTPANSAVPQPHRSEASEQPQALRLEAVSFHYPSGADGGLHQVDLTLHPGECVGVVGLSGGGKSTLLNLMLGFLVPAGGRILWGQRPLQDCLPQWQAQCGFVAQDIHLLDASIGCNIALSPDGADIDAEALESAVNLAGLDSWMGSLPAGLDTPVGEDGVQLSGGQRQRVALARALYRGPGYLFLDEPTSALDVDTESDTVRALMALKGKVTVVIVAHRLSTVAGCDRVLVLEGGRVVAEGPPQEILARYQRLESGISSG